MKKIRIHRAEPKRVSIRESREHLRGRIREALAQKKFRAECIGRAIHQQRDIADTPGLLEAYATELKYLAYQIRNLQHARLALEGI